MVADARAATGQVDVGGESTSLSLSTAWGAARERSRWHVRVAVTAVAYWALGEASLWMAIDPGYATPVWPAAGFGVALLSWQTRAASFGAQPGWRSWLALAVGLWFMRMMSIYTRVKHAIGTTIELAFAGSG